MFIYFEIELDHGNAAKIPVKGRDCCNSSFIFVGIYLNTRNTEIILI